MDDGNEVIAKIPCPNAGPPLYTTASEVATLKFLRSHTTLHILAVLAWSLKSDNHVGAEYIIMEKISGVPLAEIRETMSPLERYKVIDQIVDMEKELESLEFPAYGSIYLRDKGFDEFQSCPLPSVRDPAELFCVGPSWTSFSELADSIPQRELDLIRDCPSEVKCLLRSFDESQTIDEYGILLQKASSILPILSHDPRVTKVSRPSLWHADLHLGNILVSPEDPTTIRGIIDWQSCHITPLFVQAHFPDFLKPPKDYVPGTDIPTLPENFDKLSSQEQTQAAQNKELATLSKYYKMATLGRNKSVYDALKLDRRLIGII
ncbi:hypothetical protein MPDQ_001334 [Monascus purpureus]|uniref:Altered inheritance of mitochondria protein 9, mitochondrial n=1 Tax=Monascus purpureus TaxID=5098 RepID=A0A507QS34_MONPU|nr:hypothetical protein MPDQ_001334 [Monascus purpureus]